MGRFAKIRGLQKKIGLDDDTFRDRMELVTGKRSSKQLSDSQLRKFEANLERDAPKWKRRKASPRISKEMKPMIGKLRALWISGWCFGVVRDKGDAALTAYCERITGGRKTAGKMGVKSLAWLDTSRATQCVEAIKDMLAREARVDWSVHTAPGFPDFTDAQKVLLALWTHCVQLDCRPAGYTQLTEWLAAFLKTPSSKQFHLISDQHCNEAIRALGDLVRRARVEDEL